LLYLSLFLHYFLRIYYQDVTYLRIPASCAGAFGDPTTELYDPSELQNCEELALVAANFTSSSCPASFVDICTAAYTDNPPFSCTIGLHPDFLTTLGTAF
jgi:hypothetical protein